MNRQAMQVYFGRDIVEFYKEYARLRGKSFAAVIREAVENHQAKIAKKINKGKDRLDTKEKENRYQSFLQSLKKVQKKFSKTKYYYPELTDDELLYGR